MYLLQKSQCHYSNDQKGSNNNKEMQRRKVAGQIGTSNFSNHNLTLALLP